MDPYFLKIVFKNCNKISKSLIFYQTSRKMYSSKTLLLLLLGINLFALLVSLLSVSSIYKEERLRREQYLSFIKDTYKFNEPSIANLMLEQLDVFEERDTFTGLPVFNQFPYSIFLFESEYCKKRRAYFVENASSIFIDKNLNFLSNYLKTHDLRTTVLPKFGNDLYPHLIEKSSFSYRVKREEIRPDVDAFIFLQDQLSQINMIGKHYSCLSQISNHIPGHDILSRKDLIGNAGFKYVKEYTNRSECFNYNKFFPQTWVLNQKEQCQEFFEHFNSAEYQRLKEERTIVYFTKIGANVHGAKGVAPLNEKEEADLRALYEDGEQCGKNSNNTVIQYAVYNPQLLEGRKFDFRTFLLIASSNPVMAYFHDGYLRMALFPYDVKSTEIGTFLPNSPLSKPVFDMIKKNGSYYGLSAQEVKDRSYWLHPQLQEFLLKEGKIIDPNWLDNYLRPELKRAMIHLVRMSQKPLGDKSSAFELYGVDFMLDTNLNLWYIEANAQPLLRGWNSESVELFNDMLADSFEIVLGLLRSRMKRVIDYVNLLIESPEYWSLENDQINIIDVESRRREFKEISRNKFEPEFEPSLKNSFSKIIDENYRGSDKYMGLIKDECL